jgi:AbrB family looped-hinge helix DNA binding protein
MKTTIDHAGRIVIPHTIRDAAGLEPGTAVEVTVSDGVISIEPAAAEVRITRRGKLRVAVLQGQAATLSEDEVRTVREQVRR